jgi:hypothetical protein
MSETMWDRVFNKWRRKGADLSDAAHRADEAIRRYTSAHDRRGYDPYGREVAALHEWFANNYEPYKWCDDGCRSENARDMLNYLSRKGFIIVPIPQKHTETNNFASAQEKQG